MYRKSTTSLLNTEHPAAEAVTEGAVEVSFSFDPRLNPYLQTCFPGRGTRGVSLGARGKR